MNWHIGRRKPRGRKIYVMNRRKYRVPDVTTINFWMPRDSAIYLYVCIVSAALFAGTISLGSVALF